MAGSSVGLPLRTARLTVRYARPDDWPAYQAIVAARQSDPALWYTDHQWNLADDAMRDALNYIAGTGEWYSVCLRGGALAGYFCLGVHDGRAELGYAFHPDHRGRGYATEAGEALLSRAFRALDVQAVFAGTAAHNARSRRLLERLGFEQVRTLETSFVDGPDGTPMAFEGVEYQLARQAWATRCAI